MPINNTVDVYAKLGVLFWELDATATASGSFTYRGTSYSASATGTASDDGSDPYFGVGASYKLNDKAAVGVDWIRYTILDQDVDVLSANMRYSF